MALNDRLLLIHELEKLRGSQIITYVTSDLPQPFQAQMAMDVVRRFYTHLSSFAKRDKIDVFLFSTGGDTMVPWRLTNLIREYCQSFGVLIPYKAHSAATLLALGANEIIMGSLAELSPIDSSVQTPFNPPNADQPNEPKTPIGVEDVMGFFNLARERIGIADQENLIKAFVELAQRVHPLAIGAIYRSHALTRLLATRLLETHYTDNVQKRAIARIVDELAEKLYYHNYTISRVEADKMGLPVKPPAPKVERAMYRLYEQYEQEMQLGQPPSLNANTPEVVLPVAMLESKNFSDEVRTRIRIQPTAPGQPAQLQLQIEPGQWTRQSIAPQEG
jgi:Serine dehydrogenase proteinase